MGWVVVMSVHGESLGSLVVRVGWRWWQSWTRTPSLWTPNLLTVITVVVTVFTTDSLVPGWVNRVVTLMVLDSCGGSPGSCPGGYRRWRPRVLPVTPGFLIGVGRVVTWWPRVPGRVDPKGKGRFVVVSEVIVSVEFSDSLSIYGYYD